MSVVVAAPELTLFMVIIWLKSLSVIIFHPGHRSGWKKKQQKTQHEISSGRGCLNAPVICYSIEEAILKCLNTIFLKPVGVSLLTVSLPG
jgi:hypothetical protein